MHVNKLLNRLLKSAMNYPLQKPQYYLWCIKSACTSFVNLSCHHLTNLLPPFQHLNQAGQCLIISWVHYITRGQHWKAFYEPIQQNWVI